MRFLRYVLCGEVIKAGGLYARVSTRTYHCTESHTFVDTQKCQQWHDDVVMPSLAFLWCISSFPCVTSINAWHFSNIMLTTPARHSANQVIKEKVQDHDDDSVNKSPVAKKKCSLSSFTNYRRNTPFFHTLAGYLGGTTLSSTECVSAWK